ncbi:hypothetical protein [Chryseolinea soli]|uniref:Uncharacterized protein n=1 Tax=Chryseolinea soli TaxID=2321403 RepID=A0A385SHU1_9BACT|nr:hypothetical protein [Chryseolinea soli]AYB30021.1 hypothetical protein D4L85_05260 [Chryseolinea soli]
MNEKLIKLFGKYAVLLSVSYVIEIAIRRFGFDIDLNLALVELSIYGLITLMNVIIALVIKKDKDTFQIPTRYVYFSTILYRPVGVCSFLLYAFYNERRAKQNADEVSESL